MYQGANLDVSFFISYRHTDRNTAFAIAQKLSINNISYYLDIIDDESKSTDDITEVITRILRIRTQYLVMTYIICQCFLIRHQLCLNSN